MRYRYRFRRYGRMTPAQQAAALGLGLALVLGAAGATHHHGHGGGDSAPARAGVAAPPSSNVALGQQMAAAYGWTGSQWDCLDWLWTRESGWSNIAENPKSGAYGIAQALGHGPTNQYPADPANPPRSSVRAQIRWGLRYIRSSYGTPCSAWAHETADGWY